MPAAARFEVEEYRQSIKTIPDNKDLAYGDRDTFKYQEPKLQKNPYAKFNFIAEPKPEFDRK